MENNYKTKIDRVLLSNTFLIWSPICFYLTSGWHTRKAYLFGHLTYKIGNSRYDEGGITAFIIILYLISLFFISQKVDIYLAKNIDKKIEPVLHSLLITLFIHIASIFFDEHFNLVFKVSVIWSIGLIIHIIREHKLKRE